MSVDGETTGALSPRDGLAAQLHQLEEFVARTEATGEELPPEAVEMVARLREIMQALEGLSSSLGEVPAESPAAPSDSPSSEQS